MKRALLLLFLTMSILFAGVSSTAVTNARPCAMECKDYIDQVDGQCYTSCCPINRECGVRCFIMPCEKQR